MLKGFRNNSCSCIFICIQNIFQGGSLEYLHTLNGTSYFSS